jgi:hypothetical protein
MVAPGLISFRKLDVGERKPLLPLNDFDFSVIPRFTE